MSPPPWDCPQVSRPSRNYPRLSSLDVGEHIPGLKTSAAFFSSLRANLAPSLCDSPVSSPPTVRTRPSLDLLTLPPSILAPPHGYPTPPATPPSDSPTAFSKPALPGPDRRYSGTPDALSIVESQLGRLHCSHHLAVSPADRATGLSLLRSSLATANTKLALRAVLSHPIVLAPLALSVLLARVILQSLSHFLIATLVIGLVYLGFAAYLAWPYLGHARSLDEAWLGSDEVLIARSRGAGAASVSSYFPPADRNDVDASHQRRNSSASVSSSSSASFKTSEQHEHDGPIVGVLVLSYRVSDAGCAASGTGRNKRRRHIARGWVRGWAVASGEQGHGIGQGLLREAANLVQKRGGEGIEWERGGRGTGAERLMPALFHGSFERRERTARAALARAFDDAKIRGTRRRRVGSISKS